jgi:hypothetical protein
MPTVKITIKGLKEAMDALGIVESEMVAVAAKAAALETISVAKPYPAASRAKQPFKSDKSRRFFFAALRSGEITVPYRRGFGMQDAWDWQPTPDGAVVENAHPHADMTIVRDSRFKYHRKTWPTEAQIAIKADSLARNAAEAAIIRLVAKVDY